MPVDQAAIDVVQSKTITLLENMDLTLSPLDGRMETGFAQGPFHIIITFSVLKIVSLSYPKLFIIGKSLMDSPSPYVPLRKREKKNVSMIGFMMW